jgi:YidC/Oxa1 family membrane protein insertase
VDRRTIIAFLLIGMITFVWMWNMQRVNKLRQAAQEASEPATAAPTSPPTGGLEASATSPMPDEQPADLALTNDIPLQNEILIKDASLKYEMIWSNQGGALRQARLVDYPESLKSDQGVLLIEQPEASFSVRWSGTLQPLYSEVYTLHTVSDDSIRLWIDGQKIIDNWAKEGLTESEAEVRLDAGGQHAIVIEYCQKGGEGKAQLLWSSRSQPIEIVPAKFLFPPRPAMAPPSESVSEGTGLLGQYFRNNDLTDPVFSRLDAQVDFDWPRWTWPDPRMGGSTTDATLALLDPAGMLPLDTANYEVLEANKDRIAFTATFPNGLKVLKEFVPHGNRYDIAVKITFENVGNSPLETQYDIVAAGRVLPEGGMVGDVKGVVGWRYPDTGRFGREFKTPGSVRKTPFVLNNDNPKEPMAWAGAVNRYFAAILQLKGEEPGAATDAAYASIRFLPGADETVTTTGRHKKLDNVQTRFGLRKHVLAPGEKATREFTFFLGPKSQPVLADHPDLERLIDYGWFGVISKLLLALLNFLHRLIPNFGVGIILVTILVRICLFPISRKTQISMYRMQKLQPLVRALQEKHKDDKPRQSREMMDLYRRHNANPMGGCLPMFLQIPVFFGFYRMLQASIELRQQGFVLWINDLSRPDTIAAVSGFPIRVLPVLMVISWVVQQMMMPKPADPQQAQTQKMMMFMPIMFGFFMYSVASGLTLYWLTSTFFGILEQRLIKWQIRVKEERGEFATVAAAAAEAPTRQKPRRR